MRPDRIGDHRMPVRVPENGSNRIGDENERKEQEHPLGVAVGTEENERPDGDGGYGYGQVARDAEEIERSGNAAELGHHEAEVGDGKGRDSKGRDPKRELLSDERSQTFAGVRRRDGRPSLERRRTPP